MPTTSQINVGRYLEFSVLMRKTDSCFICGFSSGLSGSYSSALQAVELLKEEYEDPEIYVLIQKLQVLGRAFSIGSCKIEKEGKASKKPRVAGK